MSNRTKPVRTGERALATCIPSTFPNTCDCPIQLWVMQGLPLTQRVSRGPCTDPVERSEDSTKALPERGVGLCGVRESRVRDGKLAAQGDDVGGDRRQTRLVADGLQSAADEVG